MERTTKAILISLIAVVGAVVLLGLTVYPFHYGIVESLLLAGFFVLIALFKFVLDETSF